eukprot:Nk52_evm21s2340 gene=Nk52_evmTU21s2340
MNPSMLRRGSSFKELAKTADRRRNTPDALVFKQIHFGKEVVTVHFSIEYEAPFGQQLAIVGDHPCLAMWAAEKAPVMTYSGDRWSIVVNFPINAQSENEKDEETVVSYKYFVKADLNRMPLRWEDGQEHKLTLPGKKHRNQKIKSAYMQVKDIWQEALDPNSFIYNSALFRESIFKRPTASSSSGADGGKGKFLSEAPLWDVAVQALSMGQRVVELKLFAPRVLPDCCVFVCGSIMELGYWKVHNALSLSGNDVPFWSARLTLPVTVNGFEYKYVIMGKNGECMWEEGYNRTFAFNELESSMTEQFLAMSLSGRISKPGPIIPSNVPVCGTSSVKPVEDFTDVNFVKVQLDSMFRYPESMTELWRGAGIAIPVFSLRTENGMGIGEFNDLKMLSDWASSVGMTVIQLLPITDTSVHMSWWDSYPYSSLSVYALHPLYVNVPDVVKFAGAEKQMSSVLDEVQKLAKKFDSVVELDYEGVYAAKVKLLRQIFDATKKSFIKCEEYASFCKENDSWLTGYAVFCSLRDKYGNTKFTTWPEHRRVGESELASLASPSSSIYDAVQFHQFIQFHLDRQLSSAVAYCRSKGLSLKGDLPIGVDPQSVDNWMFPDLFRSHMSTGAPPDYFAVDGQNWGFPTYDWAAMAKDQYGWWRKRLECMSKYFDAYRIDHILGFFRIWEIPVHNVRGLLGYFNPAIPLHKHELESIGAWDIFRLSKPYVRTHLLNQQFGSCDSEPVRTYFKHLQNDHWQFKDEFNTERKIEDHIAIHGGSKDTKKKLFDLIANVCIIEDPEKPDNFHPRIMMQSTSSFQELDPRLKHDLERLYINYFYERQDYLWAENALRKLRVMQNTTDMLICGEDLGMIPDCAIGVLDSLSILSLCVQRMSKDAELEFEIPELYPPRAVCTPSVHDCSSIRGWWEEDPEQTQRFYNNFLGFNGEAPKTAEPWIVRKMIEQHLQSKCMLAIFPIQDLLALSSDLRIDDPKRETINIPAIRHHYWRYRMHFNLERLVSNSEFNSNLRQLIDSTGRKPKL